MGIAIVAAVFIDLVFGEPKTRHHPIAVLGRLMEKVDGACRRPAHRPWSQRVAGLITAAFFLVIAGAAAWALISGAQRIAPGLAWAAQVLLVWLSISVGELIKINKRINRALEDGEIGTARELLRALVGRQTDSLNEDQIRAAALESLAENLVDAGVAPLFYAFIGGGALAVVYRVINTLDSMFGYKNADYINFGWAAARLDDIASWLPARLTVAGIAVASRLSGAGFWHGIRTAVADGAKHPSPNSGWPMAALAGSLKVQLGGARLYEGRSVFYGYFGKNIERIGAHTVRSANRLIVRALLVSAAFGVIVCAYLRGAKWLIA